jgi:hypothetical protein
MLQRALIHLSLVLLFAFTQMGVATHEISHFTSSKHQQQDQNSHETQCGQCLSYSQAAAADIVHAFAFESSPADHIYVSAELDLFASSFTSFYSARAPPYTSQT